MKECISYVKRSRDSGNAALEIIQENQNFTRLSQLAAQVAVEHFLPVAKLRVSTMRAEGESTLQLSTHCFARVKEM